MGDGWGVNIKFLGLHKYTVLCLLSGLRDKSCNDLVIGFYLRIDK